MNIIMSLIEYHAKHQPLAAALLASRRAPLTYGRLYAHIVEVVQSLNALGLGQDDRIAVVLNDGPEMATAFLSVSAFASCAPLNPAYRSSELQIYLRDLRAKALLVQTGVETPARHAALALGIPMIQLTPRVKDEAGLFTIAGKNVASPAAGGFAGSDEVALLLHTSGTTGRPKIARITQANMVATGNNIRMALELGSSDCSLNIMPLFHLHGLSVILATIVSGGSVVCPPGFQAPAFFEWLDLFRATWYSAAPAFHQAILPRAATNQKIIARSALRVIRSGSAHLPARVMVELERVFHVPVIEFWGMTEAVASCSNSLQPNRRKSGSVGLATGTEIAIMDEKGNLVEPGILGEIVVRGPNVIHSYDNNPEANNACFVNGWLRSGDQGYLDSDGFLFLTGRLKEIINRGGEKISPVEVDGVLMDHPFVKEVATFGVPDAKLGEEVAAAVVVRKGCSLTARELREFASDRLADFKVPRQVIFVQEIPRGMTGKVERLRLSEKLGLTTPSAQSPLPKPVFVPPRTSLESQLAELWCQVLGLKEVGIHDSFSELGGDSILAAQLLSRVQQTTQVRLSLLSFWEDGTSVAKMATLLEASEPAQLQPIRPVPRAAPQLLSFAQQRLWFLDQFEPESPLYNICRAIRMEGVLSVSALQKTLDAIVVRHETLRTNFKSVNGTPMAAIAPPSGVNMPIIDLCDRSERQIEDEVRRFLKEKFRCPFNLARDLMLRATLLKLKRNQHLLLLTLHHIAADGWSMSVLFRELGILYKSYMNAQEPQLPQLPVQYLDYALWQRKWLQGAPLENQLAYWKHRLSGDLPVMELPVDRPRPAVQTFKGSTCYKVLPEPLHTSLKDFSQKENATLFMTLLAAFKMLLYRYSGQEDIRVGTPIANRTRLEIENVLGFFVNTLVMRTDCSGNPNFREFLGRVRQTALEAYAHQDLPFEKLVEEMNPKRDGSHSPLFHVFFALQNTPPGDLNLQNLHLEFIEVDSGTAKFDLSLYITPMPEGLKCMFEYNTDLLDEATISRMLDHFQVLLEAILADPDQRISRLQLLPETERRQLLSEWNRTQADYPRCCVHQLFEAQVERTPNAVAASFGNESLTYRDLNACANRLGNQLKRLGVGPDHLVGIYMERSLEMVVALLGVLKAGAAYVPLDPAYPRERLEFMINDAHMQVLLMHAKLLESLPKQPRQILCLDRDWSTIEAESGANLTSPCKPEDLAYVIYTSGSTGQPKGVMIPHKAVVNFLHFMRQYPGITAEDVLLAVTTLSFDIAALEVFLPLSVGARVAIVSREVASDGDLLAAELKRTSATVMQATPATWRLLISCKWQGNPQLKILCGGEALPGELASQLLIRCGSLWNMYGPTETTIWSTVYKISGDVKAVPIGRPIANTTTYILDKDLCPVPVGVAGELFIGGVGLARGYLHLDELTAEKFVRDPFSHSTGARLYKTGDRARYLPDGNIEYLGRMDHQVKLRGFRIELEEIESVLNRHPAVKMSAVAAREDTPGDKRLVAYIVQNPDYASNGNKNEEEELGADRISQWRTIWGDTYDRREPPQDPLFNIVGWQSSYTGTPIPEREMREWVDHTVRRILALQPKCVLELGCGSGLLLFRIAPHCTRYHGLDFSSRALEFIREQLPKLKQEIAQVTLLERRADDLDHVETCSFDVAILNSVVQYFPGVDYLLRVLERVVRTVKPGGFVFLGDVRNFCLLEAFHASVQLYQAPTEWSTSELQQRIRKQMSQEEELLIDPEFFVALRRRLPCVSEVEIQLKRGRCHNELTRFRYDVMIHVGSSPRGNGDHQVLDWRQDRLTVSGLRTHLEQTKPELLCVRGIPNARLQSELRLLEFLARKDRPETVSDLREALRAANVDPGIEPEEIWKLGELLPYSVKITWSDPSRPGFCDANFIHRGADEVTTHPALSDKHDAAQTKPWDFYVNNPLQGILARKLIPTLRNFLKGKLPEYMVPNEYVLLNAMPLTPNGKTDRKALPAPDKTRGELLETYVPPRTPVEETLCRVWCEVLGLDRVGINDNFFDMGGHSLLATQVISRLRSSFQVQLPLRSLFEAPTIASLADFVETMRWVLQSKIAAQTSDSTGQKDLSLLEEVF